MSSSVSPTSTPEAQGVPNQKKTVNTKILISSAIQIANNGTTNSTSGHLVQRSDRLLQSLAKSFDSTQNDLSTSSSGGISADGGSNTIISGLNFSSSTESFQFPVHLSNPNPSITSSAANPLNVSMTNQSNSANGINHSLSISSISSLNSNNSSISPSTSNSSVIKFKNKRKKKDNMLHLNLERDLG